MDQVNLWRRRLAMIAEAMDYYRLVPRAVLIVYGTMVWTVLEWFMKLPTPGTEHTVLVSTVIGASAVVIGLYQKSGKDWDKPLIKWFINGDVGEVEQEEKPAPVKPKRPVKSA